MARLSTREIMRQFWSMAKPYHRVYMISFCLMFLALVTELVRPFLLNAAIKAMGGGDLPELQHMALLFLGVALLDYGARSGFNFLFTAALLRTINLIRQKLFKHIIGMKMAFFDRRPVGSLLTRTINDTEALGEMLRAGAATIFVDFLTVVGLTIIMFRMDLKLTLVIALTAPLVWVVIRWCGRRLKKKFIDVRIALASSNGFMAEGISGVEILQLFGRQQQSADEFREVNKTYRNATVVSNVYDALLYAIIDAISAIATAIILFVSFNIDFTTVNVATVVVYIDMVGRVFVPIRDFSGKFAVVQQAVAAVDRILELLNNDGHLTQGEKVLNHRQVRIEFQDVNFRYQADGPKVLDGINFRVEPGQTLALVGQTGSGKSTIGKLLTRAYDGYQGKICVNGMELNQLNYHSLRAHIAVVHQDVELFPGTLRENITMFDQAISEEAVLNAVRIVKAEHLIEGLPGGLDFQVHESGNNLSAGQMQLIVFARALAHDAPVILMDEATSSVDSVTEAWIQEAIRQILKCKTVLVVAHRLSTIAAADKILVLDQGRVAEEGTHDSLLKIESGIYTNLVRSSRLQSGRSEGVVV